MNLPRSNYSRILRSTSMIGGAEGIRLLVGIVQTKCIAIFLGPVGVGLAGTYGSLLMLVGRISGLGIGASAVREVANSVASDDQRKIAQTVLSLRRVCWLTGLFGALVVALLSTPISQVTFGTAEHAWAFVLLAWVVLMRSLQTAQMVLLQGMRRIGDLARLKIIGAVGGAIIAVGFYAWLRLDGIVPAIISLAAFNLGLAWWIARNVAPRKITMSWARSIRASQGMVRLGLAFMATGVFVSAVAYLTRIFIVREVNLEAVGIFQSSFRISALSVNFIFGAMAADFYPQLSAVSNDHPQMNRLINQQTEIGLLLAVPGLLATLTFAPWVIRIFYTAEFAPAADLLQWFVLGCLGRVVSWPLGYVLVAKGKSRLFVLMEGTSSALHLLMIWVGLRHIGVEGVAIAYFVLYATYPLALYLVSRHLIGFSWSRDVRILLMTLIPFSGGLFLICHFLAGNSKTIVGFIVTIGIAIFCLRGLAIRLGPSHWLTKILRKTQILHKDFHRSDSGQSW